MITVKEMRKLEREALQHGVLPSELMETAARGFVKVLLEKEDLMDKRVAVFCGVGNNGGDGFVISRLLAQDYPVVVLLFGKKESFSEETALAFEKIKSDVTIVEINSKEDLDFFHFQSDHELVLIDALVGIGLVGEASGAVKLGIEYFNSVEGRKISVDIPSGLEADSGLGKTFCNSDLVITFHDIKQGLEKFNDKTVVVDIGLGKKS